MTLCSEIFGAKNTSVSIVTVQNFLEEKNIKLNSSEDDDLTYDNSLKVEIECRDGYKFEMKGSFLAGVPIMIEIQKISLNVVLAGKMLIIRNLNVPGVIGEIGTLLGKKSINIEEMRLGRSEIDGGETKGAIILDNDVDVPKEILEELKSLKNVVDVKLIKFESS